MIPPVLVTDGEQRAALALVRSLGRAGYPTYVCSCSGRSLAGASRYSRGEAVVPDPLQSPDDYVDRLVELVERWTVRVLIPVSEASLLAVLGAGQRFGDACIPFPQARTFRSICDKSLVLQAAHDVGIAVPGQHTLVTPQDLDSIEPGTLPFPVVLKPSRSVGEGARGREKVGVSYAADLAQLRRRVAALPDAAFPLLLQQRIVGPGMGIFMLRWDGSVRAVFAHRRIREKPPSGGVSVYRESVAADPELVRRSARLLERFDWRGVAMVEYKVDASTGTPYLMEVNGRFWGSLQLAVDAGVDFPLYLARAALGERFEPPARYRVGVRSRWWWGDVDQLLTLLRRSRARLALAPDMPPRWRSVLEFLILWRPGDRNEVFRWSDPAPLLRESVDWLARR